jgi:hypothetical protein
MSKFKFQIKLKIQMTEKEIFWHLLIWHSFDIWALAFGFLSLRLWIEEDIF